MADIVTPSSKWQVLLKSDMIFVVQSFINLIVDASVSAYLGHTTVVCQSLGPIRDLTALERNVFDLEGITHQQAVSTFCLFPQMSLSVHLNPSPQRPQAFQCCHLPHLLHFHLLYALTAFSFHLHPFVSSKPARFSTPTTVFLSLSPGRLPGREPRWCSGEAASSGSLSLQDGSMALLSPIWPRPILAPVCDCAPAGGRQSWRTKPCQYPAEVGEITVERLDSAAVLYVPTRGSSETATAFRLFFCTCDLFLHNYP